MKKIPIRRTDTERVQAGDFYDGVSRYYDQVAEQIVVKIFSGDCYATDETNEVLVTILGSCVAVCARDASVGVAGMNHFLLPGTPNMLQQIGSDFNASTRYGAYAMEQLFNQMMKLGARKERMEIKIFGGGNVINNSAMIGTKNAKFVKEYLKNEGLRISGEDVGGDYPRRIHFIADTGKVMMRKLRRKEDLLVVEEEKAFQARIAEKEKEAGDVELFG